MNAPLSCKQEVMSSNLVIYFLSQPDSKICLAFSRKTFFISTAFSFRIILHGYKPQKNWEITVFNTFFFLSLSVGEQYARMMLIFCMTMMFCVSCPLITPFGCMYFITKHYVDRHNIFYVYKPSKINKRVHATAISFVILSTVVLQFFMTIFRLVFTALWLPIYYLCVHHVILANC